MQKGKLVLIIGPSGVGKSVILNALRKKHPAFVFPKSATTRARREGERDDLYHFVTDDVFSRWIDEGRFIEWAQVHKSAKYGTLIEEIIPPIEKGNIVVREVDVQGFESIRSHELFGGDDATYRLQTIFILPESKEQLIGHIRNRAPISGDELQRRIESMEQELAYADECDVQIRNVEGKLDETIKKVTEAISD